MHAAQSSWRSVSYTSRRSDSSVTEVDTFLRREGLIVARHYWHSPKFESFSKMHRSNGHAARCCFHQIVEYCICQSGLRYAFLSNGPSPCPIGRNRQCFVVGFHSRSDRRSMMRHGRSLRHERSPLRSLVVARQTPELVPRSSSTLPSTSSASGQRSLSATVRIRCEVR